MEQRATYSAYRLEVKEGHRSRVVPATSPSSPVDGVPEHAPYRRILHYEGHIRGCKSTFSDDVRWSIPYVSTDSGEAAS